MSSKFLAKPLIQKKIKAISSIIGSFFYSCTIGVLMPVGNFCPYLMSYLHHISKEKWIGIQHGYFIFPIIFLFVPVFTVIGGFLENIIGILRTIILGEIVLMFGAFLLYESNNLYAIYSFVLLFGLGFGMTIVLSGKNSCLYFPKNKGLITAILSSFVTGSCVVFCIVGEMLINPSQTPADKENGLYPLVVAERVKFYFLLQIIFTGIFTLLALFFIVPYEEGDYTVSDSNMADEANIAQKEVLKLPTETLIPKGTSSNVSDAEVEENPTKDQNISPEKGTPNEKSANNNSLTIIKNAVHSWRVWRIILINFFTPIIMNAILGSSRKVGSMKGREEYANQIISTGGFVVSLIFTYVWGVSVDFLPFKLILVVVESLNVGIGFLYYFSLNNTFTFILATLSVQVAMSGINSIIGPHLMNVFGMKHVLEITGLCTILNGVSGLLTAFFSFIMDTLMKNNTLTAYMIIYYVCSGLAIIPLCLAFFEDDTLFVIEE